MSLVVMCDRCEYIIEIPDDETRQPVSVSQPKAGLIRDKDLCPACVKALVAFFDPIPREQW